MGTHEERQYLRQLNTGKDERRIHRSILDFGMNNEDISDKTRGNMDPPKNALFA